MVNQRIETTYGLDGEPIVLACLDLTEQELLAAAHAVRAISGERFRTATMSADDVVELRELTALHDELAELALAPGRRTVVLRPARLNALRGACVAFAESRDGAEWMREEDGEPLAIVRAMLWGLDDLCADAMRAALSPPPSPQSC